MKLIRAMKRAIVGMAFMVAMLFAAPSFATPILIDDSGAGTLNGTDVGLLDTLVAEIGTLGSPTSEEAWVNLILSTTDTSYTIKTEDVGYFATSLTGTYTFDVAGDPDYYIVKNSTYVGLFENLDSIDWGVFDVSAFTNDFHIGGDDFVVSHVTEFVAGGDGITEVPEPSVLALLGMGMVGMTSLGSRVGRRKRRS